MKIRDSHLGYWTSTRAFIWVAIGAVLGIGSIVRLPLLMAEHGGSLFLVIYLVASVVLGIPLLIAEWTLGRWMRADVVDGFVALADRVGLRPAWRHIGLVSLVGAVLLLSFYSVIAGWSLAYMFRAASGALSGSAEHARATLADVVRDPERSLAWHTLFMIVACMAVSHGYRDGIERAARYLVAGAFLIVVILIGLEVLGWAGNADLRGALADMFAARPEQVDWRAFAEAFQHAFYTLGLGVGVMATLGAYLPANVSLLRTAVTVVSLDIAFGLVAGTAVFAQLVGNGITPGNTLSVTFEQLPQALSWQWSGIAFGTLFYLLLFMATMASAITLLEPPTRFLIERMRLTRVSAATSSAVVVWYLGVGSLLSLGLYGDLKLWGRNFFDWMQLLSATVIAPVIALAIATLSSSRVPADLMRPAWGEHDRWSFGIWRLSLAYPARLVLIVVLLYPFGVFDWLIRLWS